MAHRATPRGEFWQLCTRLSAILAVGGLLLGLSGHWALAYTIFAVGAALAALAGILVWRQGRGRTR